MKKLLVILFILLFYTVKSQTVIQYDYMETFSTTYATAGWWTPALTAGWFTNTSVSPTTSAAIYGSGSGTSGVEQDWYTLPNVTGLNPLNQHIFKFRLSSRTFTNSTATSRGVDVADFVEVQVSTNGGATYISELRITGNNNATFPFTSTGVINHNANGSFTNSAAPAGDVYQSPPGSSTTGPSTVSLFLPLGITQISVDLFCRVNSAGEEWWIDNIELLEIVNTPLPIELISFNGIEEDGNNILYWCTASEKNNDYFTIERTLDGETWEEVSKVKSVGNSQELVNYTYIDKTHKIGVINYYRLSQTDFDGYHEYFNVISINNVLSQRKILKVINTLGQEVDINSKGIMLIYYNDGSIEKTIK